MNTFEFEKACKCERATARTPGITLGWLESPDGHFLVSASMHPGPVCNICETPWLRVEPMNRGVPHA